MGVLSVRNANIVFGGTAEELGIRNFEFLLRQAAKPSGELFSASPAILNCSVVNYSRQGKPRRLWRLAVAPQPPIAEHQLRRVPRGHVSIRNPLQAPKERSCGISIISLSLGSAKRDLLSSSISYEMLSVPLRGTIFRWRSRTYPQLRSFGACSGFHNIGPAPRNPQLLLILLAFMGCVATARRHSLLSLFLTWRTISNF